nr:MAG TPA: TMP repeat [Caudoviricetes sp.]
MFNEIWESIKDVFTNMYDRILKFLINRLILPYHYLVCIVL